MIVETDFYDKTFHFDGYILLSITNDNNRYIYKFTETQDLLDKRKIIDLDIRYKFLKDYYSKNVLIVFKNKQMRRDNIQNREYRNRMKKLKTQVKFMM